jgi:hypothetical protein
MPDIALPEIHLPDLKLPDGLRDMNREEVCEPAGDGRRDEPRGGDRPPQGAYQRSAYALAFWRSDGCPDDPHAFAAKYLIEAASELAVAIVKQNAEALPPVGELHQQIPRLLCDPAAIGVARAGDELDPAALEGDEEEHVGPSEPDGLDGEESQASIVAVCWRRSWRQLRPSCSRAGGSL